MDFSEDYDFLNCYRKIQESDDDNHQKNRQLLSYLYNGSLKSLDEPGTNYLLESRLKAYNTETASFENEIESSIKNILKQNNLKVPAVFNSDLHNIDIKSLIKLPENCTNNNLNCLKTPNCSDSEFQQFKQSLMRNKPELSEMKPKLIAKSFAPQTCNRDLKTVKIQNNNEEQSVVNTNCNFRTAKEELQVQNMKKYGNIGVSAGNQGGQKRKLGIRRKFVSPLLSSNNIEDAQLSSINSEEWPSDVDDRLKNIDPKMVELIKSEIMDVNSTVEWDDIAGLEFAKNAIQEAVIWPLLRPDIFTGLRRPPKGILLFGPPGTGKTLIGKCVASQSKSTFFSISASSLTSKWIGEGEKMVRTLFAVARCYQPAVIFIDEIDSLLSQRSETEHESSRRIKTEFLVQLDGATTDNDERILLIGATNRPQELDEAARRRFVKRLYIPLPEYEARLQLIDKLISNEKHNLNREDFVKIAQMSDGYSGADIRNLCSEASLGPIRAIDMRMIERIEATQVRPLLMEDFEKAFTRIRSSVAVDDLHQYIAWDKTYGSGL